MYENFKICVIFQNSWIFFKVKFTNIFKICEHFLISILFPNQQYFLNSWIFFNFFEYILNLWIFSTNSCTFFDFANIFSQLCEHELFCWIHEHVFQIGEHFFIHEQLTLFKIVYLIFFSWIKKARGFVIHEHFIKFRTVLKFLNIFWINELFSNFFYSWTFFKVIIPF